MGMRLGAPVYLDSQDPADIARAHRALGYRAAYLPGNVDVSSDAAIRRLREAFAKEDVIIAEVGAWVNPLDGDPKKAKEAREHITARLALADQVGARCCVDIVGSVDTDDWAGASAACYSDDFFALVVEVYRGIIDAVKPKNTFMTFETMPFHFLDSAEEYLRLLVAIDRPAAAAHLDLCNCIYSPRLYYNSGELARHTFKLLGGKIRSCHLKDLRLDDAGGTVKFYEVLPGTGQVDIGAYLRCADALPDCPMMLEHLPDEAAYDQARRHVQGLMAELGIQG